MTLDLAKLKEAAEKATDGQWRMSPWHIEEGPPCVRLVDEPSHIVATTASDTDAAYIALANPATILALIERLESAEKIARAFTGDPHIGHIAAARAHMEKYAAPEAIPVLKPFIKPDSFTIEELEEAIKKVRNGKEKNDGR